ncbi:MAG: HAMP domain-containing protein [Chromatiales bacterium]|nr:HAMP domain-containing protein [Gammaproteobacteria bacterium]MBW6475486.1 HAMP domain-containing protein [Chromatiales bacterium]
MRHSDDSLGQHPTSSTATTDTPLHALDIEQNIPLRPHARIPIALKLALAFILLIASGMLVLGALAGKTQTQLLEQQMEQFGSTLVQQMAESAREPLLANDLLNLERIIHNLIQDGNIMGAAIYSDELQTVVKTGAIPATRNQLSRQPREQLSLRFRLPPNEQTQSERLLVAYLTPVVFREVTVGYVLLSFDYSLIREAKQETIATVAATIALMLILALALSIYLGRRFTRPIQELLLASQAFSQGRFDYRIRSTRDDELGSLMQAINQMGEGLQRKEQVERAFSRYVSPKVAQRALAGMDSLGDIPLGGHHVEASVLFADIVGFTSLSEKMTPQEVNSLLNHYFSNIARAVHFCHGHIDKYMGDCAMIVFGVPDADEAHSFNALACAWMILELVRQMNAQRRASQLQPLEFRIGVNSGIMLAGNMGSSERMEYTVIGDAVNLASRLSHAGEPGQVILTEEMLAHASLNKRIATIHHGKILVRGKQEPISIFHLGDIIDPFRARMLEEIRRILDNKASKVA